MSEDLSKPAEQLRFKYIRLTNKGTTLFTDRHDGVPVKVPPGEAKNLPLDMAIHFFGWRPDVAPEEMFRHVCKRQGWNTVDFVKPEEDGKTKAEKNFAALLIEPVMYRLVEVERDPSTPIPADPVVPEVPRAEPRRIDVRA